MTNEEAARILSNGLVNAPSDHIWATAFKMAIKALEGQKAGKWVVYDEDYVPQCSECGYVPAYNKYLNKYYYSDWCPNCGAKMEVK